MQEQPIETPEEQSFEHINNLINAFKDFNVAASTMHTQFRELSERVEQLTGLVEEKDRQLTGKILELDRVNRYFSTVLETISVAVIVIDLEGTIRLFNKSASSLLEIEVYDAVGKPYSVVMQDFNIEQGALYTLAHGTEVHKIERVNKEKKLRIECSTNWVVDSNGERMGIVETFVDVSFLRDLENRFEHSKTLNAIDSMAATVAHEIKNPVHNIIGYCNILKEELVQTPLLNLVAKDLSKSAQELNQVVIDMQVLSQKVETNTEFFDPKLLLYDIVEQTYLKVAKEEKDIHIDLKLPNEELLVYSDASLLRMAVQNLCNNAVQAIESKGRILITLKWQILANQFVVSVNDNGKGISEELKKDIFTPFFSTKSTGSGLGLALVRKSTDLLKGTVKFDSKIDKGTTFTLSIPLRPMSNLAQRDS